MDAEFFLMLVFWGVNEKFCPPVKKMPTSCAQFQVWVKYFNRERL